jgi:hypothetical protein
MSIFLFHTILDNLEYDLVPSPGGCSRFKYAASRSWA